MGLCLDVFLFFERKKNEKLEARVAGNLGGYDYLRFFFFGILKH